MCTAVRKVSRLLGPSCEALTNRFKVEQLITGRKNFIKFTSVYQLNRYQHSKPSTDLKQHFLKIGFTFSEMSDVTHAVFVTDDDAISDGDLTDLSIPLPWGHIAAKVYGDPSNPPVLCIHGWLDNLGTFETLLPFLPKDKYYVFIDLPGHGYSSPIPEGSFYSTYDHVATVERIRQYFSWEAFSFLGHSLGGNIAGFYAGTFPERVDKMALLDVLGAFPRPNQAAPSRARQGMEGYLKTERILHDEPLAYTHEAARDRLLKANKALTPEAADILLQRGMKKVEGKEDAYYFTRDLRQKLVNPAHVGPDVAMCFLSNIKAETLHILCSEGIAKSFTGDWNKIAALFDCYKNSEYHEKVAVDGNHHAHLCDPKSVASHVVSFLQRPLRKGLQKDSSLDPSKI